MGVRRPARATGRHAADPHRPSIPALAVPLWFIRVVVCLVIAVAMCGCVGELLAVAGAYRFAISLALGLLATVIAIALAWPRDLHAERSAHFAAGTALAVGIASAVWNGLYASTHVVTDRDPGVYLATARWLMSHRGLEVSTTGSWPAGSAVSPVGAGQYLTADGALQFQFPHLVAVVLAEAGNVGGTGAIVVAPAVLGGLGLCAVYAVGCVVTGRPWLMVAAQLGLAVSLPEMFVARDTYSEPLTQALLWAALLLVILALRQERSRLALIGGLLLGATLGSRIDAIAYLIGLPPVLAAVWLASDHRRRIAVARATMAVVIGTAVTATLGTIDVQRRSSGYYHDLHSQVMNLYLALLASVVVSLIAVAASRLPAAWRHGWASSWSERRSTVGLSLGVTACVVGILAWTVRPTLPQRNESESALTVAVGAAQKLEHSPIDPRRTYGEHTVVWLGWYLGVAAVALALIGLLIATRRVIARGDIGLGMLLAVPSTVTAVYLWNPSITPLHGWASRRFVPASLGLVGILAVVGLGTVGAVVAARWRRVSFVGQAVACAALVILPLMTMMPVALTQWQQGQIGALRSLCGRLGDNAAVIIPVADAATAGIAQSLRNECDIPVVGVAMPAPSAVDLRAPGRQVWVLGSTPGRVTAVLPGSRPRRLVQAISSRDMVQTLTRPPRGYGRSQLTVFGARLEE